MKHVYYGYCIVVVAVSGLAFYLTLQHVPIVNTAGVQMNKLRRVPEHSLPHTSVVEQKLITSDKKKCACCREKLAQAKKVVQQRMQARKAWAREIFANYGYEEGMKRIAAKDPGLAKQVQQILGREKQPNLTPAVARSSSQ